MAVMPKSIINAHTVAENDTSPNDGSSNSNGDRKQNTKMDKKKFEPKINSYLSVSESDPEDSHLKNVEEKKSKQVTRSRKDEINSAAMYAEMNISASPSEDSEEEKKDVNASVDGKEDEDPDFMASDTPPDEFQSMRPSNVTQRGDSDEKDDPDSEAHAILGMSEMLRKKALQ